MQPTFWGYDLSGSTLGAVEGMAVPDFVTKNYARPSFVCRYLDTVAGYSTGLSKDEVLDSWKREVPIFPIFNRVTGTLMAGGINEGRAMGQQAINSMYALREALQVNIDGVTVWLDCEADFSPTAAVFQGWMEILHHARLVGGIYLASNQERHCHAYLDARHASAAPSMIWSSENEPTVYHNRVVLAFDPYLAYMGARAADIVCWQYSEGNTFDFNTGTEIAMRHGWHRVPITPPVTMMQVLHTCALRPRPVLQSALSLATVLGGARVQLTGHTTPHWDEVSLEVTRHGAKSILIGWVAKSNLRPV